MLTLRLQPDSLVAEKSAQHLSRSRNIRDLQPAPFAVQHTHLPNDRSLQMVVLQPTKQNRLLRKFHPKAVHFKIRAKDI
ncbi:hypothetical protein GWO14_02180 [candidate division KSB1 bacterium]|nr:hypothetical protein [candidate division KSB1 bacterium]